MKIGFPILAYRGSSITTLYKFNRAINASCVEFESSCFLDRSYKQDLMMIAKMGSSHPNSIHAPFYGHHQFDLSSPNFASFENFIENLQHWQTPLQLEKIVIHPPQDPHGSTEIFIDRVTQLSELGLLPCLENLPEYSWSDYELLFEALENHCTKVGVCYDFGHDVLRHQQDAISAIPAWVIDHLISPEGHLHLSGFSFEEDLHLPFNAVPVFKESIFPKIQEFFTTHKLDKAKGTLILETAPQNPGQIGDLLASYLDSWKMIGKWAYWSRWLRLLFIRPFILKQAHKMITSSTNNASDKLF